MPNGNCQSGQTVPLLIPEPVWREWKMNGVDADSSAEVQAEHGTAVGYECCGTWPMSRKAKCSSAWNT